MSEYLKFLSLKVNPLFIKDYNFGLNFQNLSKTYEEFKNLDDFDIDEMYRLTQDALQWSNYLSEVRSIGLVLESKYKSLESKYKGIESISKETIVGIDNIEEETIKLLNKYDISNVSELKAYQKEYNTCYKDLKKFNNYLLSQVKYFEAMHFKTRSLLNEAINKIHFGSYS